MPDTRPVSLLRLASRFAFWLLIGYLAMIVPLLLALLADALNAPESVAGGFSLVFTAGIVVLPFILAFRFGRRVRHEHGLPAGQAAKACAGGMGLLILILELKTLWDIRAGRDNLDIERLPHAVVLIVAAWAVTAALSALGAWVQGRAEARPQAANPRRTAPPG